MNDQQLPDVQLPPEPTCLLAFARRQMPPSIVAAVRDALAGNAAAFDWGLFLDLASRHRVIGLVAANLSRYGLMMTDGGGVPAIPSQHRWLLQSAYLAIGHRNQAMLDELGVVLDRLAAAGVPVVVRKGGYLTRLLYRDLGVRRLGDLDLLAERGPDTETITRCLEELGYTQGTLTLNGRRVQPLSRRLELHWAMGVSSLPPFVRPTSDPYVDAFYVDVRTGLADPSSGYEIPTAEIISRAQVVESGGLRIPVPSAEDGLIDLCVHLYREATLIYYIKGGKDLTLMKFCDVAAYLEWFAGHLDERKLMNLVGSYDIQRPVYYALHFTDLVYPGAVPRSLLDGLAPADLSFLEEYGTAEGQPARWNVDFMTRLFNPHRQWQHEGQPVMPVEKRS